MIIRGIEKRPRHLSAVVTDERTLLIDKQVLIESGLKVDDSLSEADADEILKKSDFTRAKNKALWFLSRREYSKKELFDKLKREFEIEIVEQVITLLCNSSLIDDQRFAENYTYQLFELKGLSKRAVMLELMKKGVDKQLAQQNAYKSDDDEVDAIINIINIRYSNCFDDEKSKRRMFNALVRKGYNYDDIKSAIRNVADCQD